MGQTYLTDDHLLCPRAFHRRDHQDHEDKGCQGAASRIAKTLDKVEVWTFWLGRRLRTHLTHIKRAFVYVAFPYQLAFRSLPAG
jgi:hypothetical protein